MRKRTLEVQVHIGKNGIHFYRQDGDIPASVGAAQETPEPSLKADVCSYIQQRKKLSLHYKLEDGFDVPFFALHRSLANLGRSSCLWWVISETENWNWKRQAGATSHVERRSMRVESMSSRPIKTNIPTVYGLAFDSAKLFFLPDQLLLFQSKKYTILDYRNLLLRMSPTRFILSGSKPRDSEIVDYTWQYVRKDGGPDSRFINNRRIPIVQYGCVDLLVGKILDLQLQASNFQYAEQFERKLRIYAEKIGQLP
jgi:hypothetical protein